MLLLLSPPLLLSLSLLPSAFLHLPCLHPHPPYRRRKKEKQVGGMDEKSEEE